MIPVALVYQLHRLVTFTGQAQLDIPHILVIKKTLYGLVLGERFPLQPRVALPGHDNHASPLHYHVPRKLAVDLDESWPFRFAGCRMGRQR
jgi:hypothetical protein